MSSNKTESRAHIAMNIIADIFLSSTTKFSNIAKLPKLSEVDDRLKQRALQAIQSKSPQNKKINVTNVSQLGNEGIWKGLDLNPQRNYKSPGNQQRPQAAMNQSSLSPQQGRYQTVQNNVKNQKSPQTHNNQNSVKKPIQRQHNRVAQEEVNTSRYRGQTREVTGNMVSQNLMRNQKSTKDDFSIGDKSADKKRNYFNQDDKQANSKSPSKNLNRNMTQSRAHIDTKQKRVSFSPQKPKQHLIQKKQPVQIKNPVEIKPTPIPASKTINTKQQPYVYVPPKKRVGNLEQEKQQTSQSLIPTKSQTKIQIKNTPTQSLSPKKQALKTSEVKQAQVPIKQQQPVKIKSREQIIAEQAKLKQKNPVSNSTYTYQPPQKATALKQEESRVQSKKVIIQNETKYVEKKTQISSKKIQSSQNISSMKKIENQKPVQQTTISRSIVVQENINIKKVVTVVKTPGDNVKRSNVSLNVSSIEDSPRKNQSTTNIVSRRKTQVSAQQMQKDWSKIKENLKYDKSLSPANSRANSKKVPERQDIALKMLAQLFLDASTRYFPGLSMLLKRGISKQQIEEMRSKSTEFKINLHTVEKKSPVKQQPKTERKIKWRENDSQNKDKQNNRMYQGDVTASQYRTKKPQQVVQLQKQQQQNKSKGQNIVSENLQKNHKNLTRDDSILDRHKREPSQLSNSIRQSPDVYHRQTSKKDVEESKKDLAKMKNEVSKYNYSPPKKQEAYVYQPPTKRTDQKPIESLKTIQVPKQDKPAQTSKPLNASKTSINLAQKTQIKPVPTKQQPKTPSKQLIQSKSSTNIIQTPQKPVISQPVSKPVVDEKKNVNYGQNTPKNSKIQEAKPKNPSTTYPIKSVQNSKVQEKKIELTLPQKNISIVSSKSQTSIIQPLQQAKKTPIHQAKPQPQSTYVYQAPSKKEIPAKNQTVQGLRAVQSEKVIKTIDSVTKDKTPQTTMIKKEHKTVTVESTQKKDQTITTQSQAKQPSILSKRFCTMITLIIKKRMSSNYSFSFGKIREQSQRKYELSRHASFLSRSVAIFANNLENSLKRDAFNKIKSRIVSSVNKIAKENKPVQEINNFSSVIKQGASKIILLILKEKFSSCFQPLKSNYLKIQNKARVTQQVAEILGRVIRKKGSVFLKDGFKAIQTYKKHKQTLLEHIANVLGKYKYTVVSDSFSTIINKDAKELGSKVQQLKTQKSSNKLISSVNQNALSRSKSQQVIPSIKLIKETSQGSNESVKLTPAQEAKIQAKRKQFDRKTNDLQNRKQSIQQQVNNLNKDKRAKTKKNAELKIKLKQVEKQIDNQESVLPVQKAKTRENGLTQQELVPILTRIYAYLFEDSDNTQIVVERFLSDNQHCFQLPTNPALLNQWKVINKNAELKRFIKTYEGEQPRQKKISEVLQQENQLMGKLLRSFVRERYIWEWVNIIAHQ